MNYPFLTEMVQRTAAPYGFRIYMAGDYDVARQVCREYCAEDGACVSMTRADYIYSGGEEAGFTVTVANYPRFPKPPHDLETLARTIANRLMLKLGQGSYMIEPYGLANRDTQWFSRRKTD